ncbi:MAG TPA: hypothetical protein DCZ97_11320 [Syntrophus sp. (in: bacteria)]|nr:hypothetical protein [Syntrophus sp. (in: bacteria)]
MVPTRVGSVRPHVCLAVKMDAARSCIFPAVVLCGKDPAIGTGAEEFSTTYRSTQSISFPLPYLRKDEKRGDFQVWIVDGAYMCEISLTHKTPFRILRLHKSGFINFN